MFPRANLRGHGTKVVSFMPARSLDFAPTTGSLIFFRIGGVWSLNASRCTRPAAMSASAYRALEVVRLPTQMHAHVAGPGPRLQRVEQSAPGVQAAKARLPRSVTP